MQQPSRRARTARAVRQATSVVVALVLLVGGAYVLLEAYADRADAATGAGACGAVQQRALAAEVRQAPTVLPRRWGPRSCTGIDGVRLVDPARRPGRPPFSAVPGETGDLAVAARRGDGPFLGEGATSRVTGARTDRRQRQHVAEPVGGR